MLIVQKHALHIMDAPQQVALKAGALPLHVAVQNGAPCFWALVNTETDKEIKTFVVVRTGQPCPDGSWGHVGTAIDAVVGLEWHVFMKQEEAH